MFNIRNLKQGSTLISYEMPHIRSVSIGIWINSGVITENKKNNGISHFIEHMLFKGSDKLTSKDIALKTDLLGGNINAYTTKENVFLYGKVLDDDFEKALNILIEMINSPQFDENEIEKEKKVIIDEIAMYNDTPEELGYDVLCEILYPDSTYGMPILGVKETVDSFTKSDVENYFKSFFNPGNFIISVAGNFDEEKLVKYLDENIRENGNVEKKSDYSVEHIINGGYKFLYKDLEQIHFHVGFKGKRFDDKGSYIMLVLNNILGGSASSRLFQKVREDFGLAYNIDTQPVFYKHEGFFDLYFSSSSDEIDKSVELICEEIRNIKSGEISDFDFNVSISNLKCNYLMGIETSDDYMNYMTRSFYYLDRIIDNDEIVKEIEKITKDDVVRLANEIFDKEIVGLSVIGKYSEKKSKLIYEYIKNNI